MDYEDTIVHEWCQKYRWNTTLSETPVPKFYIETSLKKWGKIHTEVLSIQCTADDAKFLKYFIVEACLQTKLQTGLFVPTGSPTSLASRTSRIHKQYNQFSSGRHFKGRNGVFTHRKGINQRNTVKRTWSTLD